MTWNSVNCSYGIYLIYDLKNPKLVNTIPWTWQFFQGQEVVLKTLLLLQILRSDDGHKKVFPDVSMIGFKSNKKLKAHLVLQLPDLDELGRSK